jgi:hypothetical protein
LNTEVCSVYSTRLAFISDRAIVKKEQSDCPLIDVDRRLQDAHRLWHQAEAAYFEPEEFRLFAQNTVQTLRTVTWVLQARKRLFPNFDAWYVPWQDRLRADPLMKWLHDARTKIEKIGDLEMHSRIRAELLFSHLASEVPRMEVPAELFRGPAELLRTIPKPALEGHVLKHGTLRIQRRWVENNLPDHELLDALAISYGRIAELVHDGHSQLGLPSPVVADDETNEPIELASIGWRMPCMIAHEARREILLALADGAVVSVATKTIKIDDDATKKLATKFDPSIYAALGKPYATIDDLSDGYFEMVRKVFERDGYHIPLLYLFRGTTFLKFMPYEIQDQSQKYIVMRALANEALRCGADAAVSVNEAWIARANELGPYQFAAELPTRREALTMMVCRKAGNALHYQAMISRKDDKVSLGETTVSRDAAAFAMAAFYEVWGRQIPDDWTNRDARGHSKT